MKKIILTTIITILVVFQGAIIVFSEESTKDVTEFGTGLAEMNDEEWSEFNAKLPLIVDIKPNEIALSRITNETETEIQTFTISNEEITPQPLGKEFSYVNPGEEIFELMSTSEFPLANAVDVSQSLTFPPIENQGSINSCVSWSLCYYQLTNNNCVVRGTEAKTSSGEAVNNNIMSPRFIYTLTNGGKNAATYFEDACAAIMSYGCPTASNYASTITISNLDEWCIDTGVWNNAMYNKPQKISYDYNRSSGVVTGDSSFVINIKRILSNGYVVTIPTYINSFVYTTKTTTGEYACRYVSNSKQGDHAMTIVGYDDNFWVDINNNNAQDSGEIGAFKIANSWGTSGTYYTNGYVWMPYDAIGLVSGVSQAPTSRTEAFDSYYFIEPKCEYTPLLIANVEMTTNRRDQIAVKVGVSDTNATTPDELVSVVNSYIAFNSAPQGVATDDYITMLNRNFTGGTTSQTVTIPFDLTPVIKKYYESIDPNETSNVKLYIEVTDTMDNNYSVTLGNVAIVEPISGKTATCLDSSNLIANNNSVTKTIDFQITPYLSFDKDRNITLIFSSNVQASTVANNIYLSKGSTIINPEYEVINNKVIIHPPHNDGGETGYLYDTGYKLHINTNVKSKGGNNLQTEKFFFVYILDEYYVFG